MNYSNMSCPVHSYVHGFMHIYVDMWSVCRFHFDGRRGRGNAGEYTVGGLKYVGSSAKKQIDF